MGDPVTKVASDLVEVEAGHVFWVRSAHDIFRKLHREKRRLERAESRGYGRSGGRGDRFRDHSMAYD